MWPGLRRLYALTPRPLQRRFTLVVALTLAGAVAELGTIGSILPFLALLADPSASPVDWPMRIARTMGTVSPVTGAAILFAIFALASGIIRYKLAGLSQDFGHRLGHTLLVDIHRRVLFQPYSFHISRNTSSLLSAQDKVESLVFDVVQPLVQALVAGIIAIAIAAALLLIDPLTALVAAGVFAAVYLSISVLTRRRLAENSQILAHSYDERLKAAQESLGGIRDVIIDQSHEYYVAWFDRVMKDLTRARTNTAYISMAPRYLVETAGMLIITALALGLARQQGGLTSAIPVLGALALGAQRLLPLVQQIYSGWSLAAGHRALLFEVLELLRLEGPASARKPEIVAPLQFNDAITFDRVRFTYPTRSDPTLDDVSFTLAKGQSMALVGPTGSGKSTLADLLMGLLEPDSGTIRIDGHPLTPANRARWQRSIAHVPQSIFLADASIARNIALGLADQPIDPARVIEAARHAQLSDLIARLGDGYETMVGERGIRLSGGQRQRLGIARAIYKRAPVLILDEATSALDEATEEVVIEALDRLRAEGRTLVIIAHRKSTIGRCDLIVRLDAGRLTECRALAAPLNPRG